MRGNELPVARSCGFVIVILLAYLRRMFNFEFCLPTSAKVVPVGPDWFHEIWRPFGAPVYGHLSTERLLARHP
jgi:hypothetical protein